MKKQKLSYKWRILSILFALLASFILSYGLLLLGRYNAVAKPWLSLITDVAPEWYMNTYYNSANSILAQDTAICRDVILFNLDEDMTRADVADVLKILAQCSPYPKAVGLDYIFPLSDNYDSVRTAYLIQTLIDLPDSFPLVLANDFDVKSVIPDSLLQKFHTGHVVFNGYNDYKPYINGIPHIALAMIEVAEHGTPQIDATSFMVNYRQKSRGGYPIQAYSFRDDADEIIQLANNNIILVGSRNNLADQHKLPFKFNGKETHIAGCDIILCALYSILTATSCNSPKIGYQKSASFRNFSRLPLWVNCLILFIFAFVYLIFYDFINLLLSVENNRKIWMSILSVIIKSILSFLSIVCIIMIVMAITHLSQKVPDITLFITMTVFMSYFYELFNPVNSLFNREGN